jgi:hypothetical protein
VRYLANVAKRRDTYRSFYPDVVQDARGAGATRVGRFLMRLLHRVPDMPTTVEGEGDAQQIVGRERRGRVP